MAHLSHWRRAYLVLLVFVTAMPALSAGLAQAKPVTLAEVIRTVLERNLSIEKEKQNIRRAEAQLRQANGKFDWQFFAQGEARQVESPREVNGNLSSDTETEVRLGASAGASKMFRNGISIAPAFSVFQDTGSESSNVVAQSVTEFGLGVKIPLLRGLGEENANAEVLAGRSLVKASELNTTFSIQRLLRNAVGAFWRSVAAQKSLENLLLHHREVGELDKTVEQRVTRGEAPPIELQRMTADAAFRSLEINRARRLAFSARRNLAMAIGSRLDTVQDLPLAVGELPKLEGVPASGDLETRYIELAREKRADLAALKRVAQSEDIRMHEARNSLKPNLDLLLDRQSLKLRYAQSLNADLERGKLSEQSVAVHEAQLNLQLLLQAIRFDVQNIVNSLVMSGETYHVTTETYELLEDLAKVQARQVAVGTVGSDSQVSTLDKISSARRQSIDALLQYAIALSELRLVTGTIDVDGSRSPGELAQDFKQLPRLP